MPVGVGAKPTGGARPASAPAKPATPPNEPPAGSAGKKGGAIKLIVIITLVVVLLISLAVGALIMLKALGILGGDGGDSGSANPEPAPTGTVLKMGEVTVATGEPININLKDGYLSFSATIYFDDTVTKGEGDGPDPSPARAAALNLFKGMEKDDLDKAGAIRELEEKYIDLLNKELIPPYNGHVVQVRFTTFAYQ